MPVHAAVATHADPQQRDEEAGQPRSRGDRQGAEREPGDHSKHATGRQRPGDAAYRPPQYATEHQRANEEQGPYLPNGVVALRRAQPRRGRQRLAIEDTHHRFDCCADAAVVVTLFEPRSDGLGDDSRGSRVIECTLDAVANLQTHRAIFLCDEQQRTVIDLAAPQLPLLNDPQGERLDRLGSRGGNDEHRDLSSLALLEGAQRLLKRGVLLRRQRGGEVGHTCLQRRHWEQILSRRAEPRRAHEQERGEPTHVASDRSNGVCHFLAPEAPMPPRSTFGGTASVASSVTLKLALTP